MKNKITSLKILTTGFFALLVLLPGVSKAAEGDVVWDRSWSAGAVVGDITVQEGTNNLFGVYLADDTVTQLTFEKINTDTSGVVWSLTQPYSAYVFDFQYSVEADSTGVYYAFPDMYLHTDGYIHAEWRIQKRDPNTGGIIWNQTQRFSSENDAPTALAIDNTGVYVAGYRNSVGLCLWTCPVFDAELVIQKRDKNSGFVIWDKRYNHPATTVGETVSDIVIDSSGLYIGGTTATNNNWLIQKRNLFTGDIIWNREESFNSYSESISSIEIDSGSLYVNGIFNFGGVWVGSDAESVIQKRNLNNGDLIAEKRFNRLVGSWSEPGLYLSINSNALYTGGVFGLFSAGNTGVTFEKRDKNSLEIIQDFSFNPTSYNDSVQSLVATESSVYLLGGKGNQYMATYGGPTNSYFLQKRELTPTNTAPTAPTISGPNTGTVGTGYTFTTTATDSNVGDTVRYGLDNNMDGVVDAWSPSSGYVTSGVGQSFTESWTTSGVKTIQFLAEDDKGNRSAWVTHNITISDVPRLIICPTTSTFYVPSTTNFSARYWSTYATVPNCSTAGYTDVTTSATWSSTNPAVLSITGGGVLTAVTPGTAVLTANYSGLDATRSLNSTLTPPNITLTLSERIVRSGATTTLNAAITADYNMTCTVYGAYGAPQNFSHTANPLEQDYPIVTKPLTSAQLIRVECVADGYPSVSGMAEERMEVIPTIQEI